MVSILVINFQSYLKITPLKIRKMNFTSKYYISLSLSNMPSSQGLWLQGKDVPSLSPTGLLRQLLIIPVWTGSGVLSKWLQLPCKFVKCGRWQETPLICFYFKESEDTSQRAINVNLFSRLMWMPKMCQVQSCVEHHDLGAKWTLSPIPGCFLSLETVYMPLYA